MTLPVWAPLDEPKPAPMPLLLVQAFVNTFEADRGTDLLQDRGQAGAWLAAASAALPPDLAGRQAAADRPQAPVRLKAAELERVRDLRESIRALLVSNGGGPAPAPAKLAPLSALAGSALRLALGNGGLLSLQPSDRGRTERVRTSLLLVIRDAQRDGSWQRLKACRNPVCRWAFYDRSHSGAGAWCDMASCGNRIKNRRLRARAR